LVVRVKGAANPEYAEYVDQTSKAGAVVQTPMVRRAGCHHSGGKAPRFRVSMGVQGKFDAASEFKALEVGNIYLFGPEEALEPKYFLVKAPYSALERQKLDAALLAEALAAAAREGGGGGGGGGGEGGGQRCTR
jgi:hypothetical protein